MEKRKITKELILVLMGFVFIGMVNVTSAQTNLILDYDSTYVDSNLRPGDSGVLQVVIKNTGYFPAEDVSINIPGTSDVPVNKKWDIGRIEPLESKTVSTTIHISHEAYIGLHTMQVRITYDGYDIYADRENDQLTVWDLPLRVYGSANFQVNVVNEGFYKDITDALMLEGSIKDGARDVSATLSSTCASITGSAKSYLGDLKKGGEFGLEYRIQPTQIGVCPLSLLMEYSDVSGNAMTENLTLGIDVQRYSVDFKVTDVAYNSMVPGTTVNLTIQLSNMGSAAADDVSMILDVSDPFTVIKSSEEYIGDIGSHESKYINFPIMIDTDADIKAHEIPLKIEYFDPAGVKEEVTKTLGIQVSGKPDICVCLDEADIFMAGVKGTVSLNVINKGFADVKFLNIRLIPTDYYEVNTVNEVYIGNLDSDDTDTEEFDVRIKNDVPAGDIKLMVEVSYKEENSNIDHIESKDVNLHILSKEEYARKMPQSDITSILFTLVGAVVGLIVLLLAIWFIYKLLTSLTGYLDRRLFKRRG